MSALKYEDAVSELAIAFNACYDNCDKPFDVLTDKTQQTIALSFADALALIYDVDIEKTKEDFSREVFLVTNGFYDD